MARFSLGERPSPPSEKQLGHWISFGSGSRLRKPLDKGHGC